MSNETEARATGGVISGSDRSMPDYSGCLPLTAVPAEDFATMIARSSFGTPEARALIESVSEAKGAELVARAEALYKDRIKPPKASNAS